MSTPPPPPSAPADAESRQIAQRKKDHINVCLQKNVEPFKLPDGSSSVFDRYLLPFTAMPEINFADIDISCKFFDFDIAAPIMISSMTGGEAHGRTINANLAIACEAEKIPFGLGSMRIVNRYKSAAYTFDVKEFCPSVPMFANLGLVQLNYGFGVAQINNLISSVRADGICIHLNHTQEIAQPEGDLKFANLGKKLCEVLPHIKVPVIIKACGHGIEAAWIKKFAEAGIKMVDVSGTGGTSWAWIEGWRQKTDNGVPSLGYLLRDTGIPTDVCLQEARALNLPGMQLLGGGGVRSGIDVAKALCLGADFATAAMPFLPAALDSPEAVRKVIQRWKHELKAAMFAAGCSNIHEMQQKRLTKRSAL